MALRPPDVARLFTLGAVHPSWRGKVGIVTGLPFAVINLPTGQVAACDPFVELGEDVPPFAVCVEPGQYRVVLSIIETTDPGAPAPQQLSGSVAAAMLQISEEPAVSWELALCDGQDGEFGDEEFFGYGVDSGTGCFADAAGTIPLGDLIEGDGGELAQALGDLQPQPIALSLEDSGYGIVAFTSGFGDGMYPTWIGRTATGDVSSFVTEFFIVPQEGRGPIRD